MHGIDTIFYMAQEKQATKPTTNTTVSDAQDELK